MNVKCKKIIDFIRNFVYNQNSDVCHYNIDNFYYYAKE